MKSAEFINLMAQAFDVPHRTMVTYTRFLKEAGLLTTGARGVNAPHMTPLDAARVTVALLACDSPGQAVDRVKRFGVIPYSSTFSKNWPHYRNIGRATFDALFEGETLEEVLSFLFGRVDALGLEDSAKWFLDHNFSLRVNDFEVLAELTSWEMKDGKPFKEIVVPFRGDPRNNTEHSKITGHIRTTREMLGMEFWNIGFYLSKLSEELPEIDSHDQAEMDKKL